MFKKFFHFIQYNNLTVLILAIVLIAGSGAIAATEAGQQFIGQAETRTQGTDNTLLLAVDLDNFDMDYKIERIEEDTDNYYVVYTYLDIVELNQAWQYQMQEKTRKVSKKFDGDLGEFLAGELKEQYEARIKDLKAEQAKARETGEEVRQEVVAYSGLIGATLDLAGKVFPGYEPVEVREVPSPSVPLRLGSGQAPKTDLEGYLEREGVMDNITDVYQNYINENDPDRDDVFGSLDNCPLVANGDQADSDGDGAGDVCDLLDNRPFDPAQDGQQTTDPSAGLGQGSSTTTESVATSSGETVDSGNTVTEEVPPAEPEVEIIDVPVEMNN